MPMRSWPRPGKYPDTSTSERSEKRNVETITKANEAGGLIRCISIKSPGKHLGLIRDDAEHMTIETTKPHDDVLGEGGMNLKEAPLIDEAVDDIAHIIGAPSIVRNDILDFPRSVNGRPLHHGRTLKVALGQIGQQVANALKAGTVIVIDEVRNTRYPRVHCRSA